MQKIKVYLREYSYLKSIHALLHWDMETMMPKRVTCRAFNSSTLIIGCPKTFAGSLPE